MTQAGGAGRSPAAGGRRRGALRAIGLSIGTIVLIGAHLSATGNPELTGPLLVLDHLFNLGLVSVLLALCLGVGLVVLSRLWPQDDAPLDQCVFGVGLGAGIVGTLILALGLSGLLYPGLLAGVLAALGWFARRRIMRVPRLLRAAGRQLAGSGESRGTRAVALALSGVVALCLLALSLTPPVDWDSLLLHLRVPSQFLEAHRIYLPADNLPSGFAALIHMLYLPLLAAGSQSGPAILSAAFVLLLGLAVFALCRRFFDEEVAWLSLVGLGGSSLILMVAVTPRVDVTLAFYTLLTHYALLQALGPPGREPATGGAGGEPGPDGAAERRRATFLLAAITAGFMVSVKYQGFGYAVALAPLVLVASSSQGAGIRTRIRAVAVFGAVAAVVALPWILKNLALFGAPLAPMFIGPRLPPWLTGLYGSAESSAMGSSGVVWELRQPFNLRDFFLAPHNITIEDEAIFYFSTPLLAMLPLALFRLRERIVAWLLLPASGFLALLLLYSTRTNLRYLIPAIVVLSIVAVVGVCAAARKLFPDIRSRRLAIGLLLMPLAFAPTGVMAWYWATNSAAVAHLIGAASSREFAETRPFESVLPVVAAEVRELVPEDARVLLLFEPRGHAFGVSVWQDSQMNHWPLIARAPADPNCLEGLGPTHVFLNGNTLEHRLDSGVDPARLGWDRFPGFRERCLELLYSKGGFSLFEIRPRFR